MSRKKLKIGRRHKRMKTLEECAGMSRSWKIKTSDCRIDAQAIYFRNFGWGHIPQKFERPDGTVSVDKTAGSHARPVAKQTIRNANRRAVKRARQRLKRQMMVEVYD